MRFIIAERKTPDAEVAVVRAVACSSIDAVLGEKGETIVAASQCPLTSVDAQRFLDQLPGRKIDLRGLADARQAVSARFREILNDVLAEGR